MLGSGETPTASLDAASSRIFFFQAEDGIRDLTVTGVQTCALPISRSPSVPAAQFSRQARDLLATTRLMLDSPAAKDARLKGLLEDLELVLAQIAQLPASGDREDVQSINQGLDQRSVLLRLRTANPAGPGPVRTQGAL